MIIVNSVSGRGHTIMTHKFMERWSFGWRHYHRVIKERGIEDFSWHRRETCEHCKRKHECKARQ